MQRLMDSVNVIRAGWTASAGGVATSAFVAWVPDVPVIEAWLKVPVLILTLVTLVLTVILQVRKIRKGD